jgi:hypothetical protein
MNEIATTAAPAPTALAPVPVDRVLSAIIAAAADPNVEVAKMRELLGLQKELMAMQAEQQFNEAFHRVSLELPRIKKNGAVEYKGKEAFRFATWDAIDAVVRPILQREGFNLSFDTVPAGNTLTITGTLSHIAGHKRTASITLAHDASGGKNVIQAAGSTFSYGRRYTAIALLNLTTEDADDDGVAGGRRYIGQEQADELRGLLRETGRQEGPFLDRLFAGAVRSLEEIEEGTGYLAARSTLEGIKRQKAAKGSAG